MADPKNSIVDRPVKVTSNYGKELTTTLAVHEWSSEEQSRRVWKRFGMWSGASVFALLVPPHVPWFILVFLSGLVATWLATRQGAMVKPQQVVCPDCGTSSPIEEQPEAWPLGVRCSPCGNVFWVTKA
jgi:hypothetical protein